MYEYAGGCDWDVLDDFPSQETFDAKYWNKLPVVIRNGTSYGPRGVAGLKRRSSTRLAAKTTTKARRGSAPPTMMPRLTFASISTTTRQ